MRGRRRPGPPDARALGRDGRRRDRGRAGRPPRRLPGLPARDRVQARSAARVPAHRRPGHLHRGHAVPAVVEEGGAGDQRGERQPAAWSCWRTCPASTGHRSRCAACSSSTAPRSAGRSSTSTARSSSASISRYHGGAFVVFSKALNPQMTVLAVEGSFASVIGGAPGRGRRVRPRGRRPDGGGPAGGDSRAPARGGVRGRRGRSWPPSWPRSAARSARRSSARSPPSSTGSTTSTGPSRSARWTR